MRAVRKEHGAGGRVVLPLITMQPYTTTTRRPRQEPSGSYSKAYVTVTLYFPSSPRACLQLQLQGELPSLRTN